jgi:hypothetical protein
MQCNFVLSPGRCSGIISHTVALMVQEISPAADKPCESDKEVIVMRVIALILVLITSAIGFVVSYGFAYRKVTGVLYSSSETVQSSVSTTAEGR